MFQYVATSAILFVFPLGSVTKMMLMLLVSFHGATVVATAAAPSFFHPPTTIGVGSPIWGERSSKFTVTAHDLHQWQNHPNHPCCLMTLRGGQDEAYDDDEDDDEDESQNDNVDKAEDRIPSRRRRRYDHNLIDPPDNDDDDTPPRRRSRPIASSSSRSPTMKKKKQIPHWTQRMASSSLKMTSQLAWGAVQQTGNLAYHIVKPRHVDIRELTGLWRLDQSIVGTTSGGSGNDMASVATVELDARQKVVRLKLPNGKTVVEPFLFQKTRMGTYKTEFVVPAFLVGETPRLYGYRGTWQRKLADKRVIKLVGKIYTVRKQRFGKEKGKYLFAQPVGTFVARRRMKLSSSEEDDEDDNLEDESDEGFEDHDEEDNEANESGSVSDAYDD